MANAWRPYFDACVENFGANRCMFESNFPVDEGARSYPVLFNAFKGLASGASASESSAPVAPRAERRFTRQQDLEQLMAQAIAMRRR
jgi:L-fuconolactonase